MRTLKIYNLVLATYDKHAIAIYEHNMQERCLDKNEITNETVYSYGEKIHRVADVNVISSLDQSYKKMYNWSNIFLCIDYSLSNESF